MYYVVETQYVGPDQGMDLFTDVDRIEISTAPAVSNASCEKSTDGWCGTTDGWAVYAHGEYDTVEGARAAISELFGDVRDSDANGDDFESDDPDVVEVYKPGQFEPLGRQATSVWIQEDVKVDIKADTTDAEIVNLMAEYEAAANAEGFTLDSDLRDFMEDRRQQLRDELTASESN